MSYEILSPITLETYINKINALKCLLGEGPLSIKEVGDGNLNQVFIVEGSKASIIVKQAIPYLRCVGESWKLSKERMHFEISALEVFNALLPEHVPAIYHADRELCLVAMHRLSKHVIMRKGLIAGAYYPKFAEHAATFLATSLYNTSLYKLNSQEKREQETKFSTNHDLCKLTEDLVFTFPYMAHESNHRFPGMETVAAAIHSDMQLKSNILQLKYRFMTQKDALLHGDFHTGSIMVNESETYIIDPEFAFIGPFGFDVGALIANLLLAYISHHVCDSNLEYANWLLQNLKEFVVLFEKKLLNLLLTSKENGLTIPGFMDYEAWEQYSHTTVRCIIQEACGFAGCKMMRRVLGLAGVAELREIKNPDLRLAAEKKALELGISLVKEFHSVQSASDIITMASA